MNRSEVIPLLIRILRDEEKSEVTIIKGAEELLIKHPDWEMITIQINTGHVFLRVPSGWVFSLVDDTYSTEDIMFLTVLFLKKHYPYE